MIKPRHLILPVLFLLAACADQRRAIPGESAGAQNLNQLASEQQTQNVDATDGRFVAPSNLDLSEFIQGASLPFRAVKSGEDTGSGSKESSERETAPEKTAENPEGKTKEEAGEMDEEILPLTDAASAHPARNLLFRAIRQVPPRDSILDVTRLVLRLRGLRLSGNQETNDSPLAGQILCWIDGKACLGKPQGAHPLFSSDARVLSDRWLPETESVSTGETTENHKEKNTEEVAEENTEKNTVINTEKTGMVFPEEVAIDVLPFLPADARKRVDFVFDHSREYSESANGFRKFRFVMGDRLRMSGGSLEIEFKVDDAKVPENYRLRPGLAKNGHDQIYSRGFSRKLRSALSKENPSEAVHSEPLQGSAESLPDASGV